MLEVAPKFSRKRMLWLALALIALFSLWYAFRPEKLFVNKRVSEPLPAALRGITPLYTGSFQSNRRETSGRATVYQKPNGTRLLTLSNFSTSKEAVLNVMFVKAISLENGHSFSPDNSNARDLGELKGNQSEQSYALPADLDFDRFNTVAIYSAGLHVVLGTAKLEAF
jgi:Electron transfer DM13